MKADLILHNGRVYTVDPARPWARAVACAGGRIVAVGRDDEGLDLAGPRTEVIDAGSRLALPGLIDGYVHLLWYATLRRGHEVNLYGVDSIKELRRRVRRAVESTDPGHWVYGRGWDERLWGVQPPGSVKCGRRSAHPRTGARASATSAIQFPTGATPTG